MAQGGRGGTGGDQCEQAGESADLCQRTGQGRPLDVVPAAGACLTRTSRSPISDRGQRARAQLGLGRGHRGDGTTFTLAPAILAAVCTVRVMAAGEPPTMPTF